MENTIIEQVFFYGLFSTIIILVAIIAVFFLIRWTVKNEIFPKWSYIIYLPLAIVVMAILCVGLLKIHLDIENKDYITYHGEYVERGGGQSDLKTVVVYDKSGKEIKLLRTGGSETGTYDGTVVYGKRSKVIVEYRGLSKP